MQRAICSKSIAIPAGQPSITPPMAMPCDSPKVVKAKCFPKRFEAILELFFDLIFIAVSRVANHQFAEEACQEQLCSNDHTGECQIKYRLLCDVFFRNSLRQAIHFVPAQIEKRQKSNHKNHATQTSKKVHGFFSESGNKNNRLQIQKAIDKTIPTEFGYTMFARVVLYYLF